MSTKKINIMFIVMVIMNICVYAAKAFTGADTIDTIFYCMVSLLSSAMYIAVVRRPLVSILLLLIVQTLHFCHDTVKHEYQQSALGITYILLIIASFIINSIIIKNKSGNKNIKLAELVTYDKPLNSIRPALHITVWSIFIALTMCISRTEPIAQYNLAPSFSIHAALSITIPAIIMIGILTSSTLILGAMVLGFIIEVYTVYQLWMVNELSTYQLILLIPTALIIIIMFILYRRKDKQ